MSNPKLHNDMVTELKPRAASIDWRTEKFAPGTVELMSKAEPGSKAEALQKAVRKRMISNLIEPIQKSSGEFCDTSVASEEDCVLPDNFD